jgi:hypothetical protein
MLGLRPRWLTAGLLVGVCLLQFSCAVPRHIWKQDDIQALTLNQGAPGGGILIASGQSDFKEAVIERLRERFESRGVYMKFIGLSELEGEHADTYDAVVVMSSCVAWGLDPRADGFLKRNRDSRNVIVLATSGNGSWLPDRKAMQYDAVSSASKQTRVGDVADEIGAKIETLLAGD